VTKIERTRGKKRKKIQIKKKKGKVVKKNTQREFRQRQRNLAPGSPTSKEEGTDRSTEHEEGVGSGTKGTGEGHRNQEKSLV